MGAGAGGFLLIFAQPENHAAVEAALTDRAARAALPAGLNYAPIQGSRGLGRADMLHNTATPRVVVPREPAPVLVDGVETGTAPATELPLAQLHHFA